MTVRECYAGCGATLLVSRGSESTEPRP